MLSDLWLFGFVDDFFMLHGFVIMKALLLLGNIDCMTTARQNYTANKKPKEYLKYMLIHLLLFKNG